VSSCHYGEMKGSLRGGESSRFSVRSTVHGFEERDGTPTGKLVVAGGFDPVDPEKGEDAAEELLPGTSLAQEEDAQGRGRDRQQVGEASKLGGFEVTKEPEIKEIGQRRAEESRVHHTNPGLPGDKAPRLEKVDS